YILSLALADLLVIITCVPFTSIVYTVESWPWGESVCKISEAAKDVSIGVSVFTLTALSADRYFAIVDPLRKLHATDYMSSNGLFCKEFQMSHSCAVWVELLPATRLMSSYDLFGGLPMLCLPLVTIPGPWDPNVHPL
ncbi:jg2681, partial [Pararge aegeria aegeria]